LTGRSHIRRMSEQELNVEEENKILLASADEAFKKKEEDKWNTALKKCTERNGFELQLKKNKRFFDSDNVVNTSSQDSQESDVTCNISSTSSSALSKFDSNY
jgi:hypothetical protein